MAIKADTIDVNLAATLHEDMVIMIQQEKELREKITKKVRSFILSIQCFLNMHITTIKKEAQNNRCHLSD